MAYTSFTENMTAGYDSVSNTTQDNNDASSSIESKPTGKLNKYRQTIRLCELMGLGNNIPGLIFDILAKTMATMRIPLGSIIRSENPYSHGHFLYTHWKKVYFSRENDIIYIKDFLSNEIMYTIHKCTRAEDRAEDRVEDRFGNVLHPTTTIAITSINIMITMDPTACCIELIKEMPNSVFRKYCEVLEPDFGADPSRLPCILSADCLHLF